MEHLASRSCHTEENIMQTSFKDHRSHKTIILMKKQQPALKNTTFLIFVVEMLTKKWHERGISSVTLHMMACAILILSIHSL